MLSSDNIQVSHIALESLIEFETSFRDTLIEQYKIMYPGLKYGDGEILQETLSLSRTLTCDFFSSYKKTTSAKLKRCLSDLKSVYGAYLSAQSTKIYPDSLGPYASTICVHTYNDYDYTIPNLDILNEAIIDIKSDYDKFVNDYDEDMLNRLTNMKNVNGVYIKNICRANSKMSVDDVYIYIKRKSIGSERKVILDYDLVNNALNKKKKFAGYIKSIDTMIDKYIHLIDKMVSRLHTHIIVRDLTSFDDINLGCADSENLFFRYELTKLSTMLNAITQVLFAQIDCVGSEINEDLRIIQEYIRVRS